MKSINDVAHLLQKSNNHANHNLFQVAPMVDVTNSYFRVFFRMISQHSLLFTEMIHSKAVLNEQTRDHKLNFFPFEKPIVFQIGGNEPDELAKAAKIIESYGYDQINLNCGCPSNKVQCGSFGACLMKDPERVGNCLLKMKQAVSIPVTCKCRLGVDDFDSYEFFKNFVVTVNKISQVDVFIIHARKAYLQGLNPKENRTVPPLKYEWVYQISKELSNLKFVLNGGIKTVKQCKEILEENKLFGIMIGRACYLNSSEFLLLDRELFSEEQNKTRFEVLQNYALFVDYIRQQDSQVKLATLLKPLSTLYSGIKGNKKFKQLLQVNLKDESFYDYVKKELAFLENETEEDQQFQLSK